MKKTEQSDSPSINVKDIGQGLTTHNAMLILTKSTNLIRVIRKIIC